MPAVPGHHNAFVRELVRGRFMGQCGADVTVPSVSRDNASCEVGAR